MMFGFGAKEWGPGLFGKEYCYCNMVDWRERIDAMGTPQLLAVSGGQPGIRGESAMGTFDFEVPRIYKYITFHSLRGIHIDCVSSK